MRKSEQEIKMTKHGMTSYPYNLNSRRDTMDHLFARPVVHHIFV